MMNLITDNLSRDAGESLFDGKDVLALGRVFRKKLGCMPQHGMYDEMGAYSFLLYTKATAFVKSAFRNTKSTLFEVQVLLP